MVPHHICRGYTLRMVVGIIILIILLFAGDADAVPVEEWNRTFGGTGFDAIYSVQQTTDGGFILAGYTESYGAGGRDAWLIKTDANGSHLWNRTFGGKGYDIAYSIQQTNDGGFILAGSTASYGLSTDAWLIKTDANGNHLWNKTFSSDRVNNYPYDEAYSVKKTSDGGFILAGYSYGEVWLIKTDASGNHQWNKTLGCCAAHSAQQTSDGGYILAGYTRGEAWLIIKVDNVGNHQWNKTFNGRVCCDRAQFVQQTLDGGYILTGPVLRYIRNNYRAQNYDPGTDDFDALLIKMDANGNYLWIKTFGGGSVDTSWSAQQTSDGGYAFVGKTYSYGTGNSDAWLIKTDSNGNIQWDRTFGGRDYDETYSIQQTRDGGYILVGTTFSSYENGLDAWLIKVSGEPDAIPPSSVTALRNTSYAQNNINWTWQDPSNTDFNQVRIYIDGIFRANVTKGKKFYNATGILPNTVHKISTRTVDTSGNINQTWRNHTARTKPDAAPPRSITNLTNRSYARNYINWTWRDPTDYDFSRIMVYINGMFRTNVSKGVKYYNATNLTANTSYRIGTHTVDTSGNINQTWVNRSTRTAP